MLNPMKSWVRTGRDLVTSKHFQLYVAELVGLIEVMNFDLIEKVCLEILKVRKSMGTIFIIGNGGSAATASHMATDLMFGSNLVNPELRAISLVDNSSILTATGNDVNFTQVFSRQLKNLGRRGDILITISASGNSPNLIEAIKEARNLKMQSVGITGFDGGLTKTLVDFPIHVPTKIGSYGQVEDLHLMINHMITSYLKSISDQETLNSLRSK
jgi:D-sedoheptulose 7-phosphate isomerase